MRRGRVLTECPISTADGVKAADVAWASPETMRGLGSQVCFPTAPEICVEVFSPSNTDSEIREKMALYFDAGAREVWVCSESGDVRVWVHGTTESRTVSVLCSGFPERVTLSCE
jgi:Uma2 family endonuclease